MFRFALIPIILIFGSILFGLVIYIIYQKIRRGLEFTYQKGSEIASQQQQKWKQKDQYKKQPKIVRKGFDDLKEIEIIHAELPEEWRASLQPLITKAKDILEEVAIDPEFENNKLSSMRSFFIHTLDSLKQFIQKLISDHKHMSDSEIESARQNINVIKADLLHHQQILHRKRKFDFEVLMDVIKARLRKY